MDDEIDISLDDLSENISSASASRTAAASSPILN
jgi:hypothetical protein